MERPGQPSADLRFGPLHSALGLSPASDDLRGNVLSMLLALPDLAFPETSARRSAYFVAESSAARFTYLIIGLLVLIWVSYSPSNNTRRSSEIARAVD